MKDAIYPSKIFNKVEITSPSGELFVELSEESNPMSTEKLNVDEVKVMGVECSSGTHRFIEDGGKKSFKDFLLCLGGKY